MSGPLSVLAPGLLEELTRHGYRPGPATKQLQLMSHLSRWLAVRNLDPLARNSSSATRWDRPPEPAGGLTSCSYPPARS